MSGPPVPTPAPGATNSPDTLTQCHCEAATLRIVNLWNQGWNQTQAQAQGSASASSLSGQTPTSMEASGSFLSATLTMGRNLIRHWEQLNGCANSASHMDPQTLQYMVDAIGWVLRDHEMAIDTMSQNQKSHASLRSAEIATGLTSSETSSIGTSSILEGNDAPSPAVRWNTPSTFVGNLELDPTEATIVIQEALSNSIFRLTVMLQDIEEEAALYGQSNADCRLRMKDLTTRLFRLLGRVTSLKTVQ